MKNLKLLSIFFLLSILFSCKKETSTPTNNNPPTTNGTSTFVLDGISYNLECFADRSIKSDGCGKIDLIIYKSGSPSFTIYHFPEDASGTFNLGDGNSQRACSQIYAYVNSSTLYASKQISLVKTGSKSFTYSGLVYDPVTNVTHTVSGEGFYKN